VLTAAGQQCLRNGDSRYEGHSMHKVGVIPFDIKDDRIAMLFVTSQRRGRWILPKGDLKAKESHKQGCKREAFEEAGVKGKILKDFPITVTISKSGTANLNSTAVTYYPMLVTEQLESWPEDKKRERHWALLDDASRLVDREDFLNLVVQFNAITPWVLEAAKRKKAKLQA
jgi:ADP-ribose pyrophosphatase YjhB (NUDIX family)